jgi:hypothetical protein
MGPQNAIIGPDSFGLDIPQTEQNDEDLARLKKAARFSRSAEFKALKEHLEGRIEFYKHNLPGGQPVSDIDPTVVGPMWIAADTIIRECEAIIAAYEQAAQAIKDDESAKRQRA